jgi:hypothetical protein
MDITSYLLGKQQGGGATPTYQEKSVTITENGTTNVTADNGYDALSKVSITTNVSGGGSDLDWSAIGFNGTPQGIKDGYNYAVQIKNNWDATQTDLSAKFSGNKDLSIMPLVDTSNATSIYQTFYNCPNLTDIALLDFSSVTSFASAFEGCQNLKTIPQFNTSSANTMKAMFYNCTRLENIPILDTSSLSGSQGLQNIVSSCPSLTDTSIDNILQMCINATGYSGTKTLARLGFTSANYPATRIQALPHYQAFLNAGWTIGY